MSTEEFGDAAEVLAQTTADRLATTLEDIGLDVGREVPWLRGVLNIHGEPVVDLGRVPITTANRLIRVLSEAAERGITA